MRTTAGCSPSAASWCTWQTSIDQQLERTRHARHRPLLNDTDPGTETQRIDAARAALYAEIADFTVSTDGRRVQLVAEEIHRELRRRAGS
jgi:shikimate kinase